MKYTENKSDVIFTVEGFSYIQCDMNVSVAERNFAESYRKNAYTALYELAFCEKPEELDNAGLLYLYSVSSEFIKAVSSDYSVQLTGHMDVMLDDELCAHLIAQLPYALGSENVTADWLKNVWLQLCLIFNNQLADYNGTAGDYINSRKPSQNVMGRVYFHLVENKNGQYPFAFLATYCSVVDSRAVHRPLAAALDEFKGNPKEMLKLLPTVLRAAEKSAFISEIVESGEIFSPIGLTDSEAYVFFSEIQFYNECGVLCRIPDWWRRHSRRVGVSVTIGENAPSRVGADALISFNISLMLDGEKLTEDEIASLLAASGGLAFIKGKWVEADSERVKETLAAYERVRSTFGSRGLSFSELMRMQVGITGIDGFSAEESEKITITNGEWLSGLLSRTQSPDAFENIPVSKGLRATLRPYQIRGYRWLCGMESMGFGACLSDDMGLGKTVQVIALLDKMRETGRGRSLLIIPASLIENWRSELDRFAPLIKYRVLHKSYGVTEITEGDNINLYITTYAMAARNTDLQQHEWEAFIIDEAQAIKNPGTKQTKSVKAIPAAFRIAMTGTPVENHLSDLWSIFDFLNCGMLGTIKEFSDFTKKLRKTGDYSKLKQAVNPFILRRLKTDKSIISDLPDKIEMKNYPHMTKKQIVLYQSIVDNVEQRLNNTDGIERKGIILAAIVKLKQLCNHPDLYSGQGLYAVSDSGKYEILAELCETVAAKRERMLIFTQFKEMCAPLDEFLTSVFGKRGLVINGTTSVKKRGEIVERFNNTDNNIPYMVLSLKAGGVGLNLTAANHVVHFDRWWNPAVENQATDRAFRIGQTKNVLVHKLITKGTIEEKIDIMIEDKTKLANELLADAGEAWITELPTEQLMSLFRLEM